MFLREKEKIVPMLLVFFIVLLFSFIVAAQDANSQEPLPKISVVSPLFFQKISGSGIVISVIENQEQLIAVWFDVNGLLDGNLPAEKNFSSDFNSLLLADGNYVLTIHACTADACSNAQVQIEILNALQTRIFEETPFVSDETAGTIGENPEAIEDKNFGETIGSNIGTDENIAANDLNAIDGNIPEIIDNKADENKADENKADENSAIAEQIIQVKGSNAFSALALYNQDGTVAASGTDFFEIAQGMYDARIDFFDSTISKITASRISLDSNKVLFEIDYAIDANAVENSFNEIELTKIFAIKPNIAFSLGKITFRIPENSDLLLKCGNWNFAEKKCSGEFEKISDLDSAETEIDFFPSTQAFGFAKKIVLENKIPDFNTLPLDENKLEPKIAKSGKKILKLRMQKTLFAANDVPKALLEITNENSESIDAEIEAFLTLPDGTTQKIDSEKIKKTKTGFINFESLRPRSFKPGAYTLTIRTIDANESTEVSQSFEFGLIAVNTRKSIYKLGETAEFEIVVLDRESYGVGGAEVSLVLVSPSRAKEILSTLNGLVVETTSSGIYIASYHVLEEGTYNASAFVKAPNIDSSISTSFVVSSDFDFDIERHTATKIDPARQPNPVQINITASGNQRKVDVKEFVPKEFEIIPKKIVVYEEHAGETIESFIDDPKFSIRENENEKIIEWKNIEFDSEGKAALEYSYSVPDKKPWLYTLGPVEIISEKESFFEARSWMIAVDANPTTIFYFKASVDFSPSEPMPNASASGDSFAQNDWAGYGMNDTASANSASRANTSFSSTSNVYVALASFTSPPLVAQTISAATWAVGGTFAESAGNDDLQLRAAIYGWLNTDAVGTSVIAATNQGTEFTGTNRQLAASGSAITFKRGDKLVAEIEYYGISPGSAVGTMYWGAGYNDGNLTAPANIRIAGDINTGIHSPANNSSKTINVAFDVNAQGNCIGYSCGDTNVQLQYCITPANGCPVWFDMNTASSSQLYISTGAVSRMDDLLNASDVNFFVFSIIGTQLGTYTIRAKIDSNWSSDVNYSNANNVDVNVTISSVVDYTFSLSYPSSGCTQGKGSIDAGTSCDKAYFETTDLNGVADQNKVDAEGQDSTTPFFVFDNQSTTSNDMNFTLDLNAALPATLKLKVSRDYNGWAWACIDNPDVNCVNITASSKNIGKAVFTTGQNQDLNIFIWADFVGASPGSEDRNTTSTSGSST